MWNIRDFFPSTETLSYKIKTQYDAHCHSYPPAFYQGPQLMEKSYLNVKF